MPDRRDSATLEEALVLPLILPKGTDPAVASSLHDALDRAIVMTLSAGQAQVLKRADRMAELLTGLFVPNDVLLKDRLHRAQTVINKSIGSDSIDVHEPQAPGRTGKLVQPVRGAS